VGRISTLITFICRNPKHQTITNEVSSPITVNGRSWAFCRSGVADDHDWQEVAGVTLEELTRSPGPQESRAEA
jgi:hypothetical protein